MRSEPRVGAQGVRAVSVYFTRHLYQEFETYKGEYFWTERGHTRGRDPGTEYEQPGPDWKNAPSAFTNQIG
jgi:hypothetical protein